MVWRLASCSAIKLLQYSRFWSVIPPRWRTSSPGGRVDHQTLTIGQGVLGRSPSPRRLIGCKGRDWFMADILGKRLRRGNKKGGGGWPECCQGGEGPVGGVMRGGEGPPAPP